MKTMKNHIEIRNSEFGIRNDLKNNELACLPFRTPHSALRIRNAFTLIELLVVIAVIGILAALTFTVGGAVKKKQYLSKTQAEMAQIAAAIDEYKTTYGFYPPDAPQVPEAPMVNQLYYELLGTMLYTNNGGTVLFKTLDSSGDPIPKDSVSSFFGTSVGGFLNCTKPGAGEDAAAAKAFLSNVKPNQMWPHYTNGNGVAVTLLVASVGGPDDNYRPLNGVQALNPWRYVSSHPTNNPTSYDLWVELQISGKTNLICNWSKQVDTSGRLP